MKKINATAAKILALCFSCASITVGLVQSGFAKSDPQCMGEGGANPKLNEKGQPVNGEGNPVNGKSKNGKPCTCRTVSITDSKVCDKETGQVYLSKKHDEYWCIEDSKIKPKESDKK